MDTYVAEDGVCVLNETNAQMEPGSLRGDEYCQIFLQVHMDDCDGCPDWQRRVEVYSNRDVGCGLEFYIQKDEDPEDPPPEENEEEPEPEPTPTPTPPEDGGSFRTTLSYFMGAASILVMSDL